MLVIEEIQDGIVIRRTGSGTNSPAVRILGK